MARETKIGLIAGLAFIICFAIILANRSPSPAGTHRPYLVDRGVTRPPTSNPSSTASAAKQRPAPRRSSRQADNRTATAASPMNATQQMPRRVDRPAGTTARPEGGAPTTGAVVQLPAYAKPMQSTNRPARSADARGVLPGFQKVSGTGFQPTASAVDRARELENRLAQARRESLANAGDPTRGATTNQRSAATRLARTQTRRTPMRIPDAATASAANASMPVNGAKAIASRRYVVLPGDTLTRIAAAQYAADSKTVVGKVVRAVFKSNKSMLASPDVLRVGAKLTLPVVDGVAFKQADTSQPSRRPSLASPKARSAKSNKPPATQAKWYQIKKNDRYVQIAREQLGDAGRWREIYELNKEKFPDPGRIRSGVRIKLPAAFASGAID